MLAARTYVQYEMDEVGRRPSEVEDCAEPLFGDESVRQASLALLTVALGLAQLVSSSATIGHYVLRGMWMEPAVFWDFPWQQAF